MLTIESGSASTAVTEPARSIDDVPVGPTAAVTLTREERSVGSSKQSPSRPRVQRLMSLLAAVVLAVAGGGVAFGVPASAAGGPIYQPPCYQTLCLGFGDTSPSFPSGPLTAWSRLNVSFTPYYITIFDTRSGRLLAACGSGTDCTANTFEANPCSRYIAYIGGVGASMPPAPVVQTSAIVRYPDSIFFYCN
jgi:hypothetical protein